MNAIFSDVSPVEPQKPDFLNAWSRSTTGLSDTCIVVENRGAVSSCEWKGEKYAGNPTRSRARPYALGLAGQQTHLFVWGVLRSESHGFSLASGYQRRPRHSGCRIRNARSSGHGNPLVCARGFARAQRQYGYGFGYPPRRNSDD